MATSLPSTDLVTQLLELEKEAMKKFKQVDKKYEMNGLQKVLKLTITVVDGPANYHDDKQMKPTLSRRKIKQRKRRDDYRRKKRSEASENVVESSLTLKARSSICTGNSTGILPIETQIDYLCDSQNIVEMKERMRTRANKTFRPKKMKNYPQIQSYKPNPKHEIYCETCEKLGIFNRYNLLNRNRWYNKHHYHHQYLKINSRGEKVSFFEPGDEVCTDCTEQFYGDTRFYGGMHFHHYKPPDDPAWESKFHHYTYSEEVDGDIYLLPPTDSDQVHQDTLIKYSFSSIPL